MARPRYPSDERRRKQRPHAKIHLSCRSHPRYGHVFEDLEARAIIWGLWVVGVQYHAAQTDNEVTLGHGDLTWITGRAEFAHALRALRAQCERMGYAVEVQGRRVRVKLRNLQRKQGLDSAGSGATTRSYAPSEEPKNQRTEGSRSHAPEKRREKRQSAPSKLDEILAADAAHEQRFHEARAQLKAEEDRDYSVAEIEARMAKRAS